MISLAVTSTLLAAVMWALSSLVAHAPSRALGTFAFTRILLAGSSVVLAIVVTIKGGWETIAWSYWPQLVLSGIIGILIGDLALHACLRRGGPRRTHLLFALNAPIAAMLAFYFLGEVITLQAGIGALCTLAGVILAVLYGRNSTDNHSLEAVEGSLILVIMFGLIAALCQAIGLIIIKPALTAGTDPLAASALRTGGSALILMVVAIWPSPHFEPTTKPTPRIVLQTILSGVMGMSVAMSLLLFALNNADAGLVAVLGSTVPVMMLPIIWITTRHRPKIQAWLGAVMLVIGVSLITTA